MKRALIVILVMLACLSRAQYIAGVLEYKPAPGQLINARPWGSPSSANTLIGGVNGSLSLGAFGGYVVFRFDDPVENHPDNPYGVDFTIFGNPSAEWSEPGIVSVMKDENENGLPDDTWYVLAGSDYFFSCSARDFEVTYSNPGGQTAKDIPWADNYGKSGFIYANSLHTQTYYPLPDSFPSVPSDSYTLSGCKMEAFVDSSEAAFVKSYGRAFGYADNRRRGTSPYSIPDNPYTSEAENSGGDAFDIAWAIDGSGNYVDLEVIHFIKVHTGILAHGGWLGELSTEITGAVDVAPDPSISGPATALVVKNLPPEIHSGTYQMEFAVFTNGRLDAGREIAWSTDQPWAFVDQQNVLNMSQSGDLEVTATLGNNPEISYSVKTKVELNTLIDDQELHLPFVIYPNPAGSSIRIESEKKLSLAIFNGSGKMVYLNEDYTGGSSINVAHLPPGLYIVGIQQESRFSAAKLIRR